jgi:nucleotidyltransferase/DNA polymerase involved in DNA repair
MHLDMDAFFAAIEQAVNPELRGRPVIVGGKPDSRGVVSTCSYEARNYGVHSAMPMHEAVKLCPHAVFIDTSGDKYSYMSAQVINILSNFSPAVEPISIDEAFVEITGLYQRYGGIESLLKAIKREIKESTGLTASVGVAPNRFIAKMASSFNKPDGLTIVTPDMVKQFLWGMPVENLWGVGHKSAESLKKIGITTIGDLAHTPEAKIKAMFGIMGTALHRMANGEGGDEVRMSDEEPDTKSMGHEHTFAKDTNDQRFVLGLLLYLSDRVSRRLRHHGYVGKTITLKVRRSDFHRLSRAVSLSRHIDNEQEIYRCASKLLLENRFLDRPIRLIGVSVSNLKKNDGENAGLRLIEYDPLEKRMRIDKLLDTLRDKHGEESVFFAGEQIFNIPLNPLQKS